MSSISSQIASLKTATAITESKSEKTSSNDVTDSNMFLKLMLKQMEQQDPTEPTENAEWLAQMAQYSTLESINNLNTSFSDVSNQLDALNETISANASITQTLSLVGKDVTLAIPSTTDEAGNQLYTTEDGKVDEAFFEKGSGMVKVNGKSYPISYVQSIRNE